MTVSDMTLSACGQAALDCAAIGWHVFPVPRGTKESHKSAKFSDGRKWGAGTDAAQIRRDWRKWPEANLGIVMGPKSGLFVVEADTAEGHDVDGIGNLAALIEEHGPLPETVEALSPSNSWHIYFRWPEGGEVFNSASVVAPGVDVRGDGGMVVAPPSVKPGSAQPYRWKNPPGRFDVAECPGWLLQLVRDATKSKRNSDRAQASGPRIDTGANAWAEAAMQREFAALFAAGAGRRNHALNTAAFNLGQIVGGGSLYEDQVRSRLIGAGHSIGLDPVEIEATVESGLAAGIAQPRSAPERQERARARQDADGGDPGDPEPDGSAAEGPEDPEEADGFDLSHDTLTQDLGARSWNENAKHVALWGSWLFWDGARWRKDETHEYMTRTRRYLRTRADEIDRWADRRAQRHEEQGEADAAVKVRSWAKRESRVLKSAPTVSAVFTLARANEASQALAEDFDNDLWLLGTPGGTVDLRTGQVRRARRADMITRLTSVGPANGLPARWLAFLDEIFAGDQSMIGFIQRAAGYSLTGETSEHRLLFPQGGGANGKSTLLETLFRIWGDYAQRIPAESLLNSHGDHHPTDIAGLRGARLVVGSELPVGKSWDESAIKDLTGGDVVKARFMRQDYFQFRPQFTLWIAGNTLPSFKGVDEALRRRVVLLPFNVTIPRERRDPNLHKKLEAEAGQILAWAMQGAIDWARHGLGVPSSVAEASTEYLDGEDTIGLFLQEATEKVAGHFIFSSELYLRFRQWLESQGLAYWTLTTFAKELKSRGFQAGRRGAGNGFVGLRLR